MAKGEADPQDAADPTYRRAVEDYYKSTLLPGLTGGGSTAANSGTPEGDKRLADQVAGFVSRTRVLPNRLKARWGKALKDAEPDALIGATPHQR